MMNHYRYNCFDCGNQFSADAIERKPYYLCPKCGSHKPNEPLKGVLLIEYDYASIRKKMKREDFLKIPAGQFWRYPFLWPLQFKQNQSNYSFDQISQQMLNRLTLNPHPIMQYEYKKHNLSLFDCTRNPTLSFKDRASILVALKAIQLKVKQIAAASTGNAASSLAGICARLGLEAHLFVPETIPEGKRIQIQSYGAKIYLVKGNYDQAFDLSIEISNRNVWYNRNTAFNPLTIEGKKSAAYDIFLSTKGNLPDVIFIPVGDGVIISGIYKGFTELKLLGFINQIPKLIAVQAERSNALLRYLKNNIFECRPARTIADSICAEAPRNLFMAADAIRKTNGNAVSVSDEKIIDAQRILSREFGVLAEPAASVTLAGYLKLIETGELENVNKIMLLITGHGLKDFESLKLGVKPPAAKTPEKWKNLFEQLSQV